MLKRFNYIIIFTLFIISCTKNNSDVINTPQLLKIEPLGEFSMSDTIGFTEMDPTSTGITAVNKIGQKEILANQHLMHGSGIALGDINNDGWVDIYVPRLKESNILYINMGGWKFKDITKDAGVSCPNRYSNGSVFADVDGDRDLDLIVTALGGPNSVFINDGSGKFTESVLESKLENTGSTSSALADVDNDGYLDL